MFKRTVFGLVAGVVVATNVVADDMIAQGMNPNMGPGMHQGMNPNMGPGMHQGMNPNMGPGMHQGMSPNRGPGMAPGHQPMMPNMRTHQDPGPFAGVQFNDEQRKKIDEMMQKERQNNQERVKAMQAAQEKLQRVYMSEKWDVDEINKAYEEIFAEQKKTIAAMAKARNEVVEIMTKEQKAQMKKMQQMQQARMQQMQVQRQQRMEQMRNRDQQQPAVPQ